MLKVAVVGIGGISSVHLNAWKAMEDCTLVAICDIRPEQLDAHQGVRHYTDFEELLAKEELDIVDICLPTNLHIEYSIKALRQKIHVVCEKPISLKVEDVAKVYAVAREENRLFMVAHVMRFWPEYEYLKECIAAKKYGRVLSASFARMGYTPTWSWQNWMRKEEISGLVPFDLHIHDIDYIVYAFGSPANTHQFRSKGENQDYVQTILEYPDFFIDAKAAWYDVEIPFEMSFSCQFEKAILELKNGELVLYEKGKEKESVQIEEAKGEEAINLPSTDAYYLELRYFADCVMKNKSIEKITAEELENVLAILLDE